MRDVAHFVTLTEANRTPEVVLHDAEVIAMVVDVGGQLGAIAPTDDALLAEPRSLPVHFQLQLIGLHETRRLAEPFAELTEEEEKPVSLSLVVAQRGIDRGMRTAVDRPARYYVPQGCRPWSLRGRFSITVVIPSHAAP